MSENQPLLPRRNGTDRELDRLAVGCILVFQSCERFVYFTVYFNLLLLTKSRLDISRIYGVVISLLFTGSGYILTIVGGIVADTVAGKYYTIFGSGVIYLIGICLHNLAGADYGQLFNSSIISTDSKRILFYVSLVCISIGTGGINANIGPLGAEQVENVGPRAVQSFFSSLHWVRNISALLVATVVAYIQDELFGLGLLMACIVMIGGQIFFFIGRQRYISSESTGSVLYEAVCICFVTSFRGICISKDRGKHYTEEALCRARGLVKIIPTFGFILLYWTVYSQMQTTYFIQAENMNLRLDNTIGSDIPVSFLVAFSSIFVVILIPVMELCIYPALRKRNNAPSLLIRIGIGMIFVTLSVFVAGIIETYRKNDDEKVQQTILNVLFNASSLSVFAQIPQFSLIGISEVFTCIAGLEFAYLEAPKCMKGMCMGLFLSTHGFGSFLAVAIIVIMRAATGFDLEDSWFPDDINHGKLEYLFYLFSGLMTVNVVFFVISSKYYRYRQGMNIPD